MSGQGGLWKEGFIVAAHSLRAQSVVTGSSGGKGVRSHCSQGPENSDCLCSAHFSFSSEAQSMGVALLTFRVTCPFSVQSFWEHAHRHIQRCVSMAILKAVRLTTKYSSSQISCVSRQ